MDTDLGFIKSGLQRLRDHPGGQMDEFPVKTHRYRLNPPLSEETVRQFESQHGITLPPGYREFLIRAGNGGAGPAYGVFKLGEVVIEWDSKPFAEYEGYVGDLSKPFPHVERWNDHTDDAKYWEPINGAIPICDIGCGSKFWLVVAGPETGRVWCDERADYAGWSPMGVTFLQWYRDWLAKELARFVTPSPPNPNVPPAMT